LVPLKNVKSYGVFRQGATTLVQRGDLFVRDGGSSNLPPIKQIGKSPNGLFSLPYELEPGLYQYQLDIWFGSGRSVFGGPDRVFHSWIRVVDGSGNAPPNPPRGSITVAEIQDRPEPTENNKLRYTFVGPFINDEVKRLVWIEIDIFDPTSMETYTVNGEIGPRDGYADPVVGVVEVPASVALSPTIVVKWDFVRGRTSSFYTIPNIPPTKAE